jgi:hypothetical protein
MHTMTQEKQFRADFTLTDPSGISETKELTGITQSGSLGGAELELQDRFPNRRVRVTRVRDYYSPIR